MAYLSSSFEDVPVDAKCRINIPSSLRKAMPAGPGDTLMISPGSDGCLEGHTREAWEKWIDSLRQYPTNDPEIRKFVRYKTAKTFPSEIDKQGRILILRKCLDLADIHDKVTIVGVIDRIEFWDPEKYEAYFRDAGPECDKIAERLTV